MDPITPAIINQLQSDLSSVPKTSLLDRITNFITKIRINRRAFLIEVVLNNILYFWLLGVLAEWQDPLVDKFYFPAFYIIMFFVNMMFYIWRLHDINRSGLWVLLILVPRILSHIPGMYDTLFLPRQIMDIPFLLFLLIKKGSDFANDYGEKPRLFSNKI